MLNNAMLIDTTLRDGLQCPGTHLSPAQRVRLAEALADVGVAEIEAGTPAIGSTERQAITEVAQAGVPCRVSAWCRAREDDLDAAALCRVHAVHLSFPVSAILLGAMDQSPDWPLSEAARLIPLALKRFDYISIGAQDASRAHPAFLARFARLVQQAGAHRLRLADTVGIWTPQQVRRTIRFLHRTVPGLPLAVHMHNDLGMATANSLTALESGASFADVTLLGIGERAGNAALEQLACACSASPSALHRSEARLHLDRLAALCSLAATMLQRTIAPSTPIVGRSAFEHASGIHVRAMLRDERAYEPFSPATVGRDDRRLLLGSHSGLSALRHALERVGIEPDELSISKLLLQVRDAASRQRAGLTDDQLRALYASAFASAHAVV